MSRDQELKRSFNGQSIEEAFSSNPEEAAAILLHAVLRGGNNRQVKKALVINHDTPPTISIPSSMTKIDASMELKRQHEEEETEIDVDRRFEGWKWQDVLVEIGRAHV